MWTGYWQGHPTKVHQVDFQNALPSIPALWAVLGWMRNPASNLIVSIGRKMQDTSIGKWSNRAAGQYAPQWTALIALYALH